MLNQHLLRHGWALASRAGDGREETRAPASAE